MLRKRIHMNKVQKDANEAEVNNIVNLNHTDEQGYNAFAERNIINQVTDAQRRKINNDNVVRPENPPYLREYEAVVSKLGKEKVEKLRSSFNSTEECSKVIDSLVWEGQCWLKDPIGGPYVKYKEICAKSNKLKFENKELEAENKKLKFRMLKLRDEIKLLKTERNDVTGNNHGVGVGLGDGGNDNGRQSYNATANTDIGIRDDVGGDGRFRHTLRNNTKRIVGDGLLNNQKDVSTDAQTQKNYVTPPIMQPQHAQTHNVSLHARQSSQYSVSDDPPYWGYFDYDGTGGHLYALPKTTQSSQYLVSDPQYWGGDGSRHERTNTSHSSQHPSPPKYPTLDLISQLDRKVDWRTSLGAIEDHDTECPSV
ncbi:hypothetical protein AQUCO_05800141v1 [Aquilegia coerulea]|uniref:LOB domain-containing protein n=1 Tax=Aquilegia coerulea TaxID=218851 RepID=A0A2G5CGC0_AQUCA|nr:hypothetical protein AQUCO_05800141v1 [Aquilegia coerulea]